MPSIRLLIVDDSVTVRAIVEEIVHADPDSRVVGVASSADLARELLPRLKPNLISLDLNMPGTNGLAFLDELAGRYEAPVIVLSSATAEGSPAREEALSRGAEACFDKGKIVTDACGFRKLLRQVLVRRKKQLLVGRRA